MAELITFYSDIRRILERARALTADFGRGFSYANLYNCRQFYLKFPEQEILYTLCRELSKQLFASKYKKILPTEAELIAEIEREKRLIEGAL